MRLDSHIYFISNPIFTIVKAKRDLIIVQMLKLTFLDIEKKEAIYFKLFYKRPLITSLYLQAFIIIGSVVRYYRSGCVGLSGVFRLSLHET